MAKRKKFLITGHGRSGTHYLAELFNCYGFQIGAERMGRDGISSAQFGHPEAWCSHHRCDNYEWDYVIHGLRNPWRVAESDFMADGPSRHHMLYLPDIKREDPLERAMMSVMLWTERIQKRSPALTVKVEDAEKVVPEWLRSVGLPHALIGGERYQYSTAPSASTTGLPEKNLNTLTDIRRPRPSPDDFYRVDPGILRDFIAHSRKYGYPERP